jgi:hypothetical protein
LNWKISSILYFVLTCKIRIGLQYIAGDETESNDEGEPALKSALTSMATKEVANMKAVIQKVGKTFKIGRQQEEVLVFIEPTEEMEMGTQTKIQEGCSLKVLSLFAFCLSRN